MRSYFEAVAMAQLDFDLDVLGFLGRREYTPRSSTIFVLCGSHRSSLLGKSLSDRVPARVKIDRDIESSSKTCPSQASIHFRCSDAEILSYSGKGM